MPITQEQIQRFNEYPFSNSFNLAIAQGWEARSVQGKEALLKKTIVTGKELAFKWYARLDDQAIIHQIKYAKGVNKDESDFLLAGLTENQVPPSRFFVGEMDDRNQLFAFQRWVNGTTLSNTPLRDIIRNNQFKWNLADLFERCHQVYKKTGFFPDLMGGETIKIGSFKLEDPRKILFPLRSSNIMKEDNSAVLVDARNLSVRPGNYKYEVARMHHLLTLLTAHVLRSI